MLSAKYVWNDGNAAGEHGNDSAAGRNVHTASASDVTDAIPTGKHNLSLSLSETNAWNFFIVRTCKVMPMYEISISKSFAN